MVNREINNSNIIILRHNGIESSIMLMLLSGMGDYFMMEEGVFAVFFPEDVHMPGISASDNTNVKKVVVKVKV